MDTVKYKNCQLTNFIVQTVNTSISYLSLS